VRIRESRIKVLMEKEGIKSQAELARRCSMRVVSLNRLIRGHRTSIGGSTINQLCRVLNAQPGDFLYYEPEPADGALE